MRIRATDRPRKDETLDAFYRGRIHILQKKKGYRFSVDAPLLADFIRARTGEEGLELGAGNGVISLLLSLKPFRRLTALEVQAGLARLAARNVRLNGLENRVRVVRGDLRRFRLRRRFDVVFSNPPYIKRGLGFPSPVAEKNIAKHEIKCDILDVMNAAARSLKRKGRAYFVYPVSRREDFLAALGKNGLTVRRMRYVRSRRGAPPGLFLAECGFGPSRRRVEAALVLFGAGGVSTVEAERIFSGRRHA